MDFCWGVLELDWAAGVVAGALAFDVFLELRPEELLLGRGGVGTELVGSAVSPLSASR